MAPCPFCLSEVSAETLACPNCRARLSRLCPVCTAEVSSVAPQCPNCRADFATGKAAAAAAPPAYAPSAPPAYASAPAYADASPAAAPAPAPVVSHVPWEDKSLGFGARFWNTCKGALVAPGDFFDAVPRKGGLAAPTAFVFLLLLGASLVTIVFFLGPLFVLEEGAAQTLEKMNDDRTIDRPGLHKLLTHTTVQVALQPIASIAVLFVFSGLVHLLAVAFGASAPFETTFRAIAYAHAPLLLAFIPVLNVFCTWHLALFWTIGLMGFAVGAMHGFGMGKGLAAVVVGLIPVLIVQLMLGHHHHRLYEGMKRQKVRQEFQKPTMPLKGRPPDDEPEPPDEMPDEKPPKEPDDGFVPREFRGRWLLDRPFAS